MKKHLLVLILLLQLTSFSFSQNVKGLYVDGFAAILGNVQKEDSLLRFAENNGFNYLTLYQMHIVNANTPLTNVSSAQTFANFVEKAKTQFSILQVGVASENFNAFNNVYHVYNQQHSNPNQKIDVYNLEFEFWVSSSVEAGGVYCDDYLQPNGIPCDTAGGFDFFVSTLHKIDSLAALDGAISEAYFGWFNDGQGAEIVESGVDRILLSAYIPSASYDQSYLEGYLSTRLERLASAETPVKVLPLMSAESAFMHDWAIANPFFLPYTHFVDNLSAETDPWKNYIVPEGIQWFTYTDMPLKNMDLGVIDNKFSSTLLYPNPVNGILHINSSELIEHILVTDLDGNVLIESGCASTLDLKDLTTGIYLVILKTNSVQEVRKCIVL